MWQNIGFILIGLGVLVLVGWGVKGFFMDNDIHALIRIAVGIMGVGVLILIGIAIRDRLRRKDDEFKEVER